MRRTTRYRRAAQVSVLSLLVAMPILAAAGIPFVVGTLCSMGIGGAGITCPVGALQTILASRELHLPLLLSASAFVILAVVAGRVFCSWICPQGLVSEIGDKVRSVFGRNKGARPDSPARHWTGRRLLLTVLAVGLAGSFFLGVPVICYVCPIGVICRTFVSATFAGAVGAEILVVGVIIAAEIAVARRGWCKYLCPVGAFYGLCTTKRSLRVTRRPGACVSCHSCETACPMGNSPLEGRILDTCTNCAECIGECPGQALQFTIGRAKG